MRELARLFPVMVPASFVGLLLLLSGSSAVANDDVVSKLTNSARIAYATTLYRDCSAISKGKASDLGRLQESWNRSYSVLKRWWTDDPTRVERALALVSRLSSGVF